jgi:hypothetical protein
VQVLACLGAGVRGFLALNSWQGWEGEGKVCENLFQMNKAGVMQGKGVMRRPILVLCEANVKEHAIRQPAHQAVAAHASDI